MRLQIGRLGAFARQGLILGAAALLIGCNQVSGADDFTFPDDSETAPEGDAGTDGSGAAE